ncbi:hypothetical protein D3C78_1648660 [compost metagenome]
MGDVEFNAFGEYETDNAREIAMLDALVPAWIKRVDKAETPKKEPEEPKRDEEPAEEEATKPAPKTRAKTAANASAK